MNTWERTPPALTETLSVLQRYPSMKGVLFDLPRLYDELAEALKGRVGGDFAKYGLALTDFFVNAITPPEDVQKVMDERTAMSAVGDPDA